LKNIYALFIGFILAQLLMLRFGWGAVKVKVTKQILRIPAAQLMPLNLLFCNAGSFAISNSRFGMGHADRWRAWLLHGAL
jgi:putative tricarboxylic transport membrane protein